MLNATQLYRTEHHDHQTHYDYSYPTLNEKEIQTKKYISKYKNQHELKHDNNNNNNTKLYQTFTNIRKANANVNAKHSGGVGVLNDIFATLTSSQSVKSPTHYIEKFINFDLLSNYDTIKNHKYFLHTFKKSTTDNITVKRSNHSVSSDVLNSEGNSWQELNCLHGIYRNKCEGDIDAEYYEAVNVNGEGQAKQLRSSINMINKCSHNLLAEPPNSPAAATLQNFQKLPECDQDIPKDATSSSGPSSSSSDFNSDHAVTKKPDKSIITKRLPIDRANGSLRIYVDAAPTYFKIPYNTNESASEHSSSSFAATTTTNHSSPTVQRTSSVSSSSDSKLLHVVNKDFIQNEIDSAHTLSENNSNDKTMNTQSAVTLERLQRRKLMQMVFCLDQENKLLQRDLAREKKRRNEELARVVKSLLCFESKLKSDMKSVNQRMQEKDIEICRLTRQNRTLKKVFAKTQQAKRVPGKDDIVDITVNTELARDLGLQEHMQTHELEEHLLQDCLVLEALQCINCRKQFYDIGIKEGWTQTNNKVDGKRNDDHTTELGTSSDDTVSSSFYGARRSVRYTSKRTPGTFRDYMRSRSMHVDDVVYADGANWENTSTLSRDSHTSTSNEKLNFCNTKTNKSNAATTEEDDGIFSPTQDDDFEDYVDATTCYLKTTPTTASAADLTSPNEQRTREFSEASPKQIYETSTDDWYTTASDQEDIGNECNTKCYTPSAVNPVLECVNQILLQQAMEEPVSESNEVHAATKEKKSHLANLPRRSSLSGRRHTRSNSDDSNTTPTDVQESKSFTRKRVHFSTKNSMVHLPRQDSDNEPEVQINNQQIIIPIHSSMLQQQQQMQKSLPSYHGTRYFTRLSTTPQATMVKITAAPTSNNIVSMQETQDRLETLNYESIYSNEYEPIGSEHNSSNLYIEMDTERHKLLNNDNAANKSKHLTIDHGSSKMSKIPPALPPKPANLIKFKKSVLQVNEIKDDQRSILSEPEYCSISEVNVDMTSVQIVADVHPAPVSVAGSVVSEEIKTLASDDEHFCAASQKTDEIEEIFADIPKLPNVAAIIAPKNNNYLKQLQTTQEQLQIHQSKTKSPLSDYLSMTSKVPKSKTVQKLRINTTSTNNNIDETRITAGTHKLIVNNGRNSTMVNNNIKNDNDNNNNNNSLLNNSIKNNNNTITSNKVNTANALLKDLEAAAAGPLPLQAEFDWYNLDAEYGKAKVNVVEHEVQNNFVLSEIHEDQENEPEHLATLADEYNLDEEFCHNSNVDDMNIELNTVIRENIKTRSRTKKMHKNLDTFEKFIEGSGLSTKPLPHQRKIYFAGPFV